MKRVFLFLFLSTATVGFSQNNDTTGEAAKRIRQRDSVMDYYQKKRDSLDKVERLSDSVRLAQEFRNNTDYFVRLQKESRAKQKKAAMTRIAIGIAGFAFLIIMLIRRRKKSNVQ